MLITVRSTRVTSKRRRARKTALALTLTTKCNGGCRLPVGNRSISIPSGELRFGKRKLWWFNGFVVKLWTRGATRLHLHRGLLSIT